MADSKSDALRWQMINAQLRTSDINDLDLLAAFAAVPREDFVAPAQRALAYSDGEVASNGPAGRKLLSPRTLGLLLKSAAPAKGERALVVGGGAGYCAALLVALGLDVVALETQAITPPAAGSGSLKVVEGPLTEPPPGLFDVIVLNGAFEQTPSRLIDALAEGGRLVGLRAGSRVKQIAVFERSGAGVSERALYDAGADVLPGFARKPAFAL